MDASFLREDIDVKALGMLGQEGRNARLDNSADARRYKNVHAILFGESGRVTNHYEDLCTYVQHRVRGWGQRHAELRACTLKYTEGVLEF